jgi:hypothetical protein
VNVLFFVEPLVMHNRPFHYWAWLGVYAEMARALEAAGHTARFVVNEALAARATAPLGSGEHYARRGHGLSTAQVTVLPQTPIRALFDRPNLDILGCLNARADPERERAYAALVREALGGFTPDVMMSLTPAPQLSVAFPPALLLATETAAYSRAPFPFSIFFDPSGLWGQSLLGAPAAAFSVSDAERALLLRFRARFSAYFRETTPYGALEARLRERYARVAFLPLQFGGESGFDLNGPFRNQGEYLWHVLEALPDDTALLVVEHPTAHWVGDVIDEETREFLGERYPQLCFVDFRSAESSGQYLVHHADFVIGVSTSLALQALLFEKPVVSIGHGHLKALATVHGLGALGAGPLPRTPLDDRLAWLISRYFVPMELARTSSWLVPFLERSLERARRDVRGPAFLDPIADPALLGELLFRGLERPRLQAELENGAFAAWPRGPGPFGPGPHGPHGPAGWELLDFGGAEVSVSALLEGRSPRGARIERTRAGSGATLFLQRVPDLERAAGRLARLRFRARGTPGATLAPYFYLQFADGRDCHGTAASEFELDAEPREFTYVTSIPELGDRRPGAGSHLEVVFAVPATSGAVTIELFDVTLEPVEC